MRVGSPNGVSGRVAFDRWFRYPAGFSPTTLAAALDIADSRGGILVDPFAGSASAGTRVIDDGSVYVGIEAHPLIAELGQLKFARPGDPDELAEKGANAAARARLAIIDGEASLVQRCFDADTLAWLVGMRQEIESESHRWSQHLKWALLGTLRDVASVKVGWPYQRPSLQRQARHSDPSSRFIARVKMMAEDLASAPSTHSSRVVAGSSTQHDSWQAAMAGELAQGCVTSPPYLNNFDYADATRLEVYFLQRVTTWAGLCQQVRHDMLVATTQQTRVDIAAKAVKRLAIYPELCAEVSVLIDRLAAERMRRGRGKEYDRVLAPYFVGIARVLSCMHEHLRPGAKCAWIVGDSAPYGIYVDTPRLISLLAEELGYEVEGDEVLRTRGQRWRTNGTRHQVALSERLISFARPS